MMHVITGGSGSGKSAYAEMWLTGKPEKSEEKKRYAHICILRPCVHLVQRHKRRFERHRQMRAGKGFQTLECYGDLRMLDDSIQRCKRSKSILDINKTRRNEKNQENVKTGGILLECVSNLLADVLYQEDGSLAEDEAVLETIVEGIRYLNTQTERLAIVTNEVHSDLQDYSEETKKYIGLLGKINQELGKMADQVTEVVYGIPIKIK